MIIFVHFKLFTIFLHEIVLSVEIKRGSLGWMNLCQTWIRYLYLQWIEYLPRSLNSCFMKRPLKFDEISKFYLKLFSSVKKSLEISSYLFVAFSEYINFTRLYLHFCTWHSLLFHINTNSSILKSKSYTFIASH